MDDNSVFNRTPSKANMSENPSTKQSALSMIARRCVLSSPVRTPARYAKNPGMIGSTQGARNDTSPAINAAGMETENMLVELCVNFCAIPLLVPAFGRFQNLPAFFEKNFGVLVCDPKLPRQRLLIIIGLVILVVDAESDHAVGLELLKCRLHF